jgi:hypothetical protein
MSTIICDTCCCPIEKPEDGWLAWLNEGLGREENERHFGFSLTHHRHGCMAYDSRDVRLKDGPLPWFLGTAGLASLLALLVRGAERQEIAQIIARLHLTDFANVPEDPYEDPYDYLRDVMRRWA